MKPRKHNFRKWLESKNPCATVGDRWTCSGPVAVYLQERTGQQWFADAHTYWVFPKAGLPLPVWAQKFELASDNSGRPESKIQARTALKILGEIAA